jgi:hypothetical protein
MRVSLGLLAFGTLTTWLLAGPVGLFLEETLPFHTLHVLPTDSMISTVVGAPATWLALAVIAAGILIWGGRNILKWLSSLLAVPAQWAAQDFGFEWVNRGIVGLTQRAATALRTTQTGYLNWNVAGILIGLIIVLVVLAGSGLR